MSSAALLKHPVTYMTTEMSNLAAFPPGPALFGARAADLLPRSKTVWLENSIHDVPLQRPGLVADTIIAHIRSGFFDAATP